MTLNLYWGDTHHNSYTAPEPDSQTTPLPDVLAETALHLDFYSAAYYMPDLRHVDLLTPIPGFNGTHSEHKKPNKRIDREWAEVQAATAALNRPGKFTVFPGYEWQGDGTWGDHNVICFKEGLPVLRVATLPELYNALRGLRALAIPHHIGYRPGSRAPRWEHADTSLTPFAEIYSIHGCSETDEDWIGLRRNTNMGPGITGGTYADALNRGLILGAIASTDNWSHVPGRYNQGLMACLAEDLTRESLWAAFCARRVYALTGDRIALRFTLNDEEMGSVLPFAEHRKIRVEVIGEDEVDRIELLRDNRVIATHCHQGTWSLPSARTTWKLRLEMGWGAKPGTLPWHSRNWLGEVSAPSCAMRRITAYRVSPQPTAPTFDAHTARFNILGRQSDVLPLERQNAVLLEFEGSPSDELTLRVNGAEHRASIAELAHAGTLLDFGNEQPAMVEAFTGMRLSSGQRQDVYFHTAPKLKIHRAMPASAWQASLEFEDDAPLTGLTNYRIRVEQRNGQRAWSSPIWVKANA